MQEIDAVITWVNGNDPNHRAKRLKYGDKDALTSEDKGGSTRFDSLGEIFWCVASINRFAPFIHKIFIVTDEQDPGLEPFMQEHFPAGYIPMEIIDHKVIYRGYEQYLPTFNSIALETMTWRIPGLSDLFIEFNDDLLLNQPVQPEDFFSADGKPICYASKTNLALTRLTRILKGKKNGRTKVSFKGNMWNAAKLVNQKGYMLKVGHTPKSLNRVFYEKYFNEHPESMIHNISYRFRDAEQFTPQEVQYLSLYRKNECLLKSYNGLLFYLMPKHKEGYVDHKLARLKQMKDCKFLCFNSIDKATEDEREQILNYISSILGFSIHVIKN